MDRTRVGGWWLALGLLAFVAACGPSAAPRPPEPFVLRGTILVTNGDPHPVEVGIGDWPLKRIEPGATERFGPFSDGRYVLRARAVGGTPWRSFDVEMTHGAVLDFEVRSTQPIVLPVAEPVAPPPRPVAEPTPPGPTPGPALTRDDDGEAPPRIPRRTERRKPRVRPDGPAEAPPGPARAPDGPAEAPPAPVLGPPPGPEAPPWGVAEAPVAPTPPPPPRKFPVGRGELVVRNGTSMALVIWRVDERLGEVAAGRQSDFAVPSEKVEYRAVAPDGVAVARRAMAVRGSHTWSISGGLGQLVVSNPSEEPFEVQLGAAGTRVVAPGEDWTVELPPGSHQVRAQGQRSGRRVTQSVAVSAGLTAQYRLPVVEAGLLVVNGSEERVVVFVDGARAGTLAPGGTRWTRTLSPGAHRLRAEGQRTGATWDEAVDLAPGETHTWTLP